MQRKKAIKSVAKNLRRQTNDQKIIRNMDSRNAATQITGKKIIEKKHNNNKCTAINNM